jgi:hypothetical protein
MDRMVTGGPRLLGFWSIRGFGLFAGVAIALGGCGGSSRLSADELAKRADAICARYQAAYRRGSSPTTVKAFIRYVDRTRPIAAREERELRALQPGPSEVAKVRRLLDDVRTANQIYLGLRNAFVAHPDVVPADLARRLRVVTRRNTEQARALGWTVCAADPRKGG